jgi:hypothetical protein
MRMRVLALRSMYWVAGVAAILVALWIPLQSMPILVAAVVGALVATALYRYAITGEDAERGVMLAQRSGMYQAESFDLVL